MLGASQAALLGGSAGSLENGMVAWYPLNGDATDATGNGWSGTVNGATATTDRFGVSGKAMSFDGINDFITLNPDIMDNATAGTVSLWFNRGAWTENYSTLIVKSNAAPFNNHHISIIRVSSTDKIAFEVGNNVDSTTTSVFTAANINENVWNHVAMTWNGSVLIGYLNGQEIGRFTTAITIPADSTQFSIGKGAVGTNRYFYGSMDDIRLYNRALSAAEIQQLYGL